jgi:BirA family biotin operon repressor/biotin-[acetyl-CoA-carboxylase] ligase
VCLTVICGPATPGDVWRLSIAAGVAVAEALRTPAIGVDARVRFPNDVLIDGAKVSGVLIETVTRADQHGTITPLVGIGVNVNVAASDFPEDLQSRATSLLRVTGREMVVESIRSAILARFDTACTATETAASFAADVLPRWHAIADPDAVRDFILGGERIPCRVRNVASDGAVSLDATDGRRFVIPAARVILGDA